MKIIVSHPTSNQNNRAVVKGLHDADLLQAFYTTVAVFPGNVLDRLGSFGPFSDLERRRFEPHLQALTKTMPYKEIGRILSARFGFSQFLKQETGLFCIDAVYQHLDKKVAANLAKEFKRGSDAVYAYEDGAYLSFLEAKKQHLECLYDLPIGYWRAAMHLMAEEIEKWPDWASTLTGFNDSQAKLDRKDAELQLADRIFVASSFTAKTLQAYPGTLAPVHVIPYGFPKPFLKRTYSNTKGPLKLLFVGGLSQRKGIANMFAAVENLGPHVQLTVVGGKIGKACAALDAALSKHTWIPSLPHHEVLEIMRSHDVLVFPSLFEGFGLVITEAMSQGTPVITTDRTAGPDLIEHGRNGWLVEAGSTPSLQACLEGLIKQPEQVIAAGKAALETAKKRPWSIYGHELAEAIMKTQTR